MEQNLAILIADLSGYTALTEAHGPFTAADMIDKYVAIVKESLVGETQLHQCIGDEVLIVSSSPDSMISTAIMLMKRSCTERNFLQIHGGLHYGKTLKRNNNYFGSTINLTSRIAAKATKGAFWCSDQFVNSLSDKDGFIFQSKGKHQFKNVSEEHEVLELVIENSDPFFVDPVCRMLVNKKETAIQHPDEESIFFCSHDCLNIYKKSNPL